MYISICNIIVATTLLYHMKMIFTVITKVLTFNFSGPWGAGIFSI